ncbi:MAG: LAGLIDADG family homing endonuclease, partial [Chloroflexales bacterium]
AHKGEREVFAVRVGTRTIKATANHPFLTLSYHKDEERERGRYTRGWKYLHELAPGDLVAVAKDLPDTGVLHVLEQPEIKTQVEGRNQHGSYALNIAARYNAVTLPECTTEDLMWWLGLYIGDGFIHATVDADKARVEVAIPASDTELRAELIRVTEELFGLTPTSNDPYRVSINSTIVARFLEANGMAGKALTKRVPSWIFGLPQTQKLAFLGGYLDSDGYVRDTLKNHDIMLTSGNRELLQDMTELLALCGLPTSTIHRFESKHPVDQERMVVGYRIQVAGDYERIGSRSPNRLSRMDKRKYHHDYSSAKGTTFRSHVTEFHGYVKIGSITPAGSEVVYDIEVDGPHNFVAEGLIVHNSEVVYHSLREEWSKLGVIFLDTDTALKEYPEFFKEYFGKLIPAADNKYAALNTAVWSGGSFVYVPKGVKVDIPLQAYFRINAESMGQFERTLIIIDEGAEAHYIEGCFRAGARVVTEAGEKPIEQIEVGDKVLTHRGRYRKVYHTMQRPYQGDIYTMRYWGDSSQALEVTAEHPLLVVKRQRMRERNTSLTLAWMPASEVREGDYLAIPLARPEPEQVPVPSVTIPYRPQGHANALQREISFPQEPDFYRLLGYYFAEGHVSNEHYLTFSFHAQEVAYLEDTTELLTRYFGKAPLANKERQNGQTLVLCSTEAARAFAYEFGSTVYEKHVPAWLNNAPRHLLAEFVRGLWCGDGSYDATKNMFRFNS